MAKSIDVLCVGEIMMAFVNADFAHNPKEASLYRRMPSGEVALMGAALSEKGLTVHAVGAVGQDELGLLLVQHLEQHNINTSGVTRLNEPTTLVLQMRGAASERIQAYRGADAQLAIRQFPYAKFEDINWFHTSAFALSKDPARRVIIEAKDKALRAVCRVSLHLNFASCPWPDTSEAQRILANFSSNSALVCLAEADWIALFGEKTTPREACMHYMKTGAKEVLYTTDGQQWWAVSDEGTFQASTSNPVDTYQFMAAFMAEPMEDRSLEERLQSAAG